MIGFDQEGINSILISFALPNQPRRAFQISASKCCRPRPVRRVKRWPVEFLDLDPDLLGITSTTSVWSWSAPECHDCPGGSPVPSRLGSAPRNAYQGSSRIRIFLNSMGEPSDSRHRYPECGWQLLPPETSSPLTQRRISPFMPLT